MNNIIKLVTKDSVSINNRELWEGLIKKRKASLIVRWS